MLKRSRPFLLLLMAAILLQIAAPYSAKAAAGGPTVTGSFPINASNTVPQIVPKISFNENIQLVPGGAARIELWEAGAGGAKVNTTVQIDDSNKAILIVPQTALTPSKSYFVLIPSDAVYSYATGIFYDGISSNAGWTFTVDALAPSAVAPDGLANVDFSSVSLSLSFNAVMAAGSGYIQLKRDSDNVIEESFAASAGQVTVNNGKTTITFSSAKQLQPNTKYYVLVDPGALVDNLGNPYAGMASKTGWTFTTKPALDTAPPTVASVSPGNGSTLEQLTGSLTIAFNKNVFVGSGNISVKNKANNNMFCIIPASSSGISISGGTAVINPVAASCPQFANNTSYYVEISDHVFRDASGNYFAGYSGANAWYFNAQQDTTAPTAGSFAPASGATNVNTSQTELSVTFNEAVKLAPGATAQLINIGNSNLNASLGLAVDPANNKRVVLNVPANTLRSETQYSVLIPGTAVTDMAGNAFAGILNNGQWTFKTLNTSSVPQLSDAKMEAGKVLLTYSEDLDASKVPSTGNFFVTSNESQVSVTGVAISGKEVRLTLTSGVLVGQNVRVTYYPDSFSVSRRIQNVAGKEAAAFSNRTVTNTVDTTQPKPESGTFSGSMIILNFNRELATMVTGFESQFVVRIGTTQIPVTSAFTGGTTLFLTIPTQAATSLPVSVSYAASASPLRDQSGNFVAAFSNFFVRNAGDTIAPQLLSAALTGSKLALTFSEGMNPANVPAKSSFSVLAGGNQINITNVAISNSTVELTLGQTVNSNLNVQIYYFPGTPALTDLNGNPAAAITGYGLTSGSTAVAQVASLNITGNQLIIGYNAILSASSVPYASQYAVKYGGANATVSAVSVSGAQVYLTMAAAPTTGQAVTLSYSVSGIPLKDSLNQQVAAINNSAVNNQGGTGGNNNAGYPDYLQSSANGGVEMVLSKTTTPAVSSTGNGKSVKRYMVNGDKLAAAFSFIKSGSTGTNPQVVLSVPSSESGAFVAIPVTTIQSSALNVSNGQIMVEYGDAQFTIPLKAVNYSKELQKLGGSTAAANAFLLIGIEKASAAPDVTAIAVQGGQRVTSSMDFTASILFADKEYPIGGYDSYVKRTFVVPAAIGDPNQLAVVRLDELTGKVTYVPTKIVTNGSNLNVDFYRKGNSVYTVVFNNASFTDMRGHWAESDVKMLAAKYIVGGPTRTTFAPKKDITRAEFAEFIVRGLGLNGDKASASKFSDVVNASLSASYIGAASAAGIVQGANGKFRPNASVTREEMATMMVRAMSVAGVQTSPDATALSGFGDRGKVSSWAKDQISVCVQAGIIGGITTTKLAPQNNTTRAEAAIMLKRFLTYVDFL